MIYYKGYSDMEFEPTHANHLDDSFAIISGFDGSFANWWHNLFHKNKTAAGGSSIAPQASSGLTKSDWDNLVSVAADSSKKVKNNNIFS